MIKVLVVDDQKIIREGLIMMLGLDSQISIAGQAENGLQALELLDKIQVDLLLMDIRMPLMDGVEATKEIKEKHRDIKILILTTFKEDEYIFQGLKNGADGYLLKDIGSEELIHAIKTVHSGNMLLQGDVAKKMMDSIHNDFDIDSQKRDSTLKELTKREYEIAILVGEGKNNKEISEKLFITLGTVKNHISKILDKINIRDRTKLALMINESREKM